MILPAILFLAWQGMASHLIMRSDYKTVKYTNAIFVRSRLRRESSFLSVEDEQNENGVAICFDSDDTVPSLIKVN